MGGNCWKFSIALEYLNYEKKENIDLNFEVPLW